MSGTRFVHLRRCHVCGGVCEREDAQVERCDHCGKTLAPYFFFEEETVLIYSDDEQRPEEETMRSRPPNVRGPHRPLRGLSARW